MSGVVEGGWSCVTQMSIPSFVTGIPPGYTLGIATCSQVGTGHPWTIPFPGHLHHVPGLSHPYPGVVISDIQSLLPPLSTRDHKLI